MFWAPYLSFCRISNTLFIIVSCFLVIFPPALFFFPLTHFLTLQLSLSDYIFCTICHPLSSSSYLSHHLLGIGPLCPLYLHAICVSCRSPSFVAWSPCLPRGSLSFARLFHLIPAFLFRSVSILLSTLIFSLLHLSRFALPIHRMVWKALERKSFVWIKKPMVFGLLSTTRTDTTVMESCTRFHYFFHISTSVCLITARSRGQHLHSK